MSVLNIIKEGESFEHISLKEAINLLAKNTNSKTHDIVTYLLNKDVAIHLDSYARQRNYRIELSSSNEDEAHWNGENRCFMLLDRIAEIYSIKPSFRVWEVPEFNKDCEEHLWNREDFFNLECIKSLNLFNGKEFKPYKQQYIWDTNYLSIQQVDTPPPLDINEDQYLNYSFSIEDADYPVERWLNEPTEQIKKHPLYFKNKTFSVHEATCLMAGYDPRATQWDYENINWLVENPEYEQASSFICSAVRTSLFEEFSNGEHFITSVNLKALLAESNLPIDGFSDCQVMGSDISEQENKELRARIEQLEKELYQEKSHSFLLESEITLVKENLSEKDAIISTLRKNVKFESGISEGLYTDLITAKDENTKLRTEINLIESKNAVLEDEKIQTNTTNSLLSLIFDESAAERYAPDLVLAIKLWEHIYIINSKDDSHSSKADTWLKNNTGYDIAKKAGSASKIREVTAPFLNWSTHRDKAHKK